MEIKSTRLTRLLAKMKRISQQFWIKTPYSLLALYQCCNSGHFMVLLVKRGHMQEQRLLYLMEDKQFLATCDKQTLYRLAYLIALENMQPDYRLLAQHMDAQKEDCTLEIYSQREQRVIFKYLSELKNSASLIQFNSIDAHRIGYLTGMREAIEEFNQRAKLCVPSDNTMAA